MEHIREAGSTRLHPTIFNSRYYYLLQLKKKVEEIIHIHIKGKKFDTIVDYGCGNVPYKPLFTPFVNRYQGADLALNKTADIHIESNGRIDLANNSTDIVLSTQVLEHVENPLAYLSEAHRILKNDGLLILTTHGYWMYHPDPTDFWRWTSAGLRKIVEESGYEIVGFSGVMGRSSMGLQLFQDGIYFKLPKVLNVLFSTFMQLPIFLFDKINRQSAIDKDACTYIVVAKAKK